VGGTVLRDLHADEIGEDNCLLGHGGA
jgi:hypothetical protein